MGRLNWRRVGCFALCVLPIAARSQTTPINLGDKDGTGPANVVGGTPTIDLITVRANSPGVPLRHGNVIRGSERVQLGAAILQPTVDYSVDYDTGVVYICRAMKPGDAVTVSYRYDAQKSQASTGLNLNGITGFTYDIAPGAMRLGMGLGMTERTADGQVLRTNLFGLTNNFSMGSGGSAGGLKGLFYFGQQEKADANSLYDVQNPGAKIDEGMSQLILQSYQGKALGGTVSADYQSISKNFRAFGVAGAAGYNAGQLEKEKGLTRMALGLKDLKIGSMALGTSYKSIADGKAGIDWRSYSFASNGLQVNWSSQSVDRDFTRFGDLAEGDREQLRKELGLSRQSMSAQFAGKVGQMSLTTDKIEDMRSGGGLERRKLQLNTGKLKFELGDQEVDQSFGNRIGSLKGDEQGLYGREVGLKRQWLSLEMGLLGKNNSPIKFSQSIIDSKGGSFTAQDFSVAGKGWSLEHSSRKTDLGFTGFAPLSATAEGDAQIAAIANMYGKGLQYNVGAERNWLLRTAGIERSFNRFSFQPMKDWNINFENLQLQGQKDGGSVDTISVNNKNLSLKYRKQDLGKQFNELSSMMDFERQQLGPIVGMNRTDFAASLKLKNGNLTYTQLNANAPEGGVSRQQFALDTNKLKVTANTREVDAGFNAVGMMVDPEKDFLAQLKGFREHDVKVAWQILPNLHLDFFNYSADSDSMKQQSRIQNMMLNWKPSRNTEFNYVKLDNDSNDPLSVLFANITEKMSLVQNLGKYGVLRLEDETQDFDGVNNTLKDFHRQYLSYETSVDKNTKIRTEQTRTNYDNGDKESISANTVSTKLSNRVGVSLTETKIDRAGDDRDESNRNYGFWYDLGNGIQIAYGYARQLNGDNGTTQQNLNIGANANQTNPDQIGNGAPASLGNLNIGGGYGERSWDGSTERTQAFSKMSIGTKKPFRFGMFSNVKLNFGVDTAADYSKWIRENKMVSMSANVGSNTLGYSYLGQMYTDGFRAVDRSFSFATDQSDKRWLRASIFYKIRTLPWGDQVMIRNFNFSVRPNKDFELSHQLVTNPEVAKGDAILGSIPQAARSNAWKLDYKKPGQYTLGGEWKELINDQNKALSRTASVNLTLFEKSGSPLKLSYGLEEFNDNIKRRMAHRYSIQFDQRPGPNQTLSLFAGNVSYQYDLQDGFKRNNWTLRLDYQLRF